MCASMVTDTLTSRLRTAGSPGGLAYTLKLLAGPLAFVVVMALPIGLSYQGHVALATFVCAVVALI